MFSTKEESETDSLLPSLIVNLESIRLSCSAAYTKRFTVRYLNFIAILTHPSLLLCI